MKRIISDRGSVLMEFVIVAPMLFVLIFGIIQIAYICWAKQLTFYAAYSAARAALVYNPSDYSSSTTEFFPNRGPVYVAACTVMSWMNMGDGRADFDYFPRNSYSDGKVADTWRQVRVSGIEHLEYPAVEVTVHYYCPLLIPLIGDMIAYLLGGSSGDWTTIGWLPETSPVYTPHTEKAPSDEVRIVNLARSNGDSPLPALHLQETCYMAKPYTSQYFGRIPNGDWSSTIFGSREK